ncbi:MAG: DUF3822 family protein [Prevotella sp.]|nr:DUF3822 family protein [Prevotella sp.]
MAETSNAMRHLTLRLGRGTMSILLQGGGGEELVFEPCVVKNGMSMAANLREAFKNSDLLLMQMPPRVRVLLDSDVLMVPVELFDEQTMATMYAHAFPSREQEAVFYNVLPDLNAVAVFSMNKDLRLVLDDHFQDVRLVAAMQPVWRCMHQRSFTGVRRKLYVYFHEKRLDMFSFQQNRFRFCNAYDAPRPMDAVFYITYVWKQLQLQEEHDELYLMGDISADEQPTTQLQRFIKKVMVIQPQVEFSHHPVTELKGVPFDLQTLVVKGR